MFSYSCKISVTSCGVSQMGVVRLKRGLTRGSESISSRRRGLSAISEATVSVGKFVLYISGRCGKHHGGDAKVQHVSHL